MVDNIDETFSSYIQNWNEDNGDDLNKLLRQCGLFNELERRIVSTNEWLSDYEQLYKSAGLILTTPQQPDEPNWPKNVAEFRKFWKSFIDDGTQQEEKSEKEVHEQEAVSGIGKGKVGLKLPSQPRGDSTTATKRGIRSKGGVLANRRLLGSSLVSEIIECMNMSLKLSSILPDVLIRRLGEGFRTPQLRKGKVLFQFPMDETSILFDEVNDDYSTLVIPSFNEYYQQHHQSLTLTIPHFVDAWTLRLNELLRHETTESNHHPCSNYNINKIRIPTIIEALQLLKQSNSSKLQLFLVLSFFPF